MEDLSQYPLEEGMLSNEDKERLIQNEWEVRNGHWLSTIDKDCFLGQFRYVVVHKSLPPIEYIRVEKLTSWVKLQGEDQEREIHIDVLGWGECPEGAFLKAFEYRD